MIARLIAALAALLLAAPALAHLSPNSAVYLDFGERSVLAEIVIPASELAYARGQPVHAADASVHDYLAKRIAVRSPDGRPWAVRFEGLRLSPDAVAPDIEARLRLTPPEGAPLRRFTLRYAPVIDSVPNHFALVFARSDYGSGRLNAEPELIGGLQKSVTSLAVDRGASNGWRGFAAAIRLGMEHIAEGHDHLLFLIALILPAPLLAGGGRWGGFKGTRPMLHTLVSVVTAFTIGHSVTLIGGAFFGWRLPARPVEVLIALSILISAIHALRPLFPGREAWVAGGFGLIHGLAFATLIGDYGLEPMQKAQSILGFNLGIEIVQLGLIACVAPSLLVFARTDAYRPMRVGGALFAGVAATAWIAERVSGTSNAVAGTLDAWLGHAGWLIVALGIGAVALALGKRLPRRLAAEGA